MEKKEKYKVFVSRILNSQSKDESSRILRVVYHQIKENLEAHNIELIALKNTSDIWARDYMPIKIEENTFVTYEYKPDYLSCKENQKYITNRFSSSDKIKENKEIYKNKEEHELPLYKPNVTLRECHLILDGGNVVVCGDKIILTDKVFIENRSKTTEYVIGELKRAFGKEVVIIPSDPYEIEFARENYELPLCHADGILAPINDDTIIISDYGKDPKGYVPALMNVLTRYFKPENIKQFDFGENWTEDAWVYINFLRVGDMILIPEIEYNERDKDGNLGAVHQDYLEKLKACNAEAKRQLKSFSGVENIVGIDTTALTLGINKNGEEVNPNCGGALHCISWEVKEEEHTKC